MTTPLSYALVTPSYEPDFERCRLLVESVARWVAPHVKHYLIIEQRDLALFRPLANARTEIVVVQDLVPGWLLRLPGVRRFWLSLRTRPVRNWLMQQIVKLSAVKAVSDDVLLFIDSDAFFIREYDPRELEREGRVPLFRETGQRGKISFNDLWHGAAAQLLGLPVETGYDTNYISQIMCWRRDNVLKLHQRIAATAGGRDWRQVMAGRSVFSEYILYGEFCARVLGDDSGHWYDGVDRTLCYWDPVKLDVAGLQAVKARRAPEHYAAMISAKSHTAIEDIRKVFL